jgi:hypothetical protein
MGCRGSSRLVEVERRKHSREETRGFLCGTAEKSRKTKMAGKKDARAKAGPDDRTEKNTAKRPRGAKGVPKEAGQRAAGEMQRRPLQEQPGVNPGRGAQGPMEDIQGSWEARKEIDKVLDHLEGRLDRITAVIRRTS